MMKILPETMTTKECLTFLTMLKEQLARGNIPVVESILDEKIKKLGLQHSAEMLSIPAN